MKRIEISNVAARLARNKFADIERWIYSETTGELSLRAVELGIELDGRELLRLLLQGHVDCRGQGNVGPAIEVFQDNNAGSVIYTHTKINRKNLTTIFGKIRITRLGYYKPGKSFIHPLDEKLQLPKRTYSYELQRRLVKKAVQGPFDEALESLLEATGVKVPKRSAEGIVIDASIDFDNFYRERQSNAREVTGSILVGSIDCKGIPMIKKDIPRKKVRRKKGEKAQKKKMATVATVYTQKPYIRTPEEVVRSLFEPEKKDKKGQKPHRPENKRVWASLTAGKDMVINEVRQEMNRRAIGHNKLYVVVTDGERCLQLRAASIMKNENIILVLDLLHVLEKLWEAANALHGEGTMEAELFVRQRALRILKGNVSQVVKGLRAIVTKRNLKGNKQKTIISVSNYYFKNRKRMRYHKYLKMGIPIASGAVEGACKNLIRDRMERSGMRWSSTMAEAMLKMRAIYLSGDFNEYWNYHINQQQKRLYPKGKWKPLESPELK